MAGLVKLDGHLLRKRSFYYFSSPSTVPFLNFNGLEMDRFESGRFFMKLDGHL